MTCLTYYNKTEKLFSIMARKLSKKYVPKELSTIPQTGKYYKWCPYCKKNYWSDARGQKYCSPECQKKDYEKRKKQKQNYAEIAPVERLRVRFHSLHVELVKTMVQLKMREWKCDYCGKHFVEGDLPEVHHVNYNWTDGTPSNLQLLHHNCHTKVHSEMQKKLDEEGLLIEEYVDSSFEPLMKVINKDKDL